MQMLEEILQEIEGMVYPSEEIGCGLEDAGITDRYEAAAYGFEEATERILEIIRSYRNDGWIPCSERLPEENGNYICTMQSGEVMVCRYGCNVPKTEKKLFRNNCAVNAIAWQPLSKPYRPKKSIGEDYKQRVMERFLKVE